METLAGDLILVHCSRHHKDRQGKRYLRVPYASAAWMAADEMAELVAGSMTMVW